MRALLVIILLLAISTARAYADRPSVGVNVNVITGSFQGSQRQSARLPTLPIPAVTLNVPIGAFEIRAEEVPPIGPVQYGDGFGGTQGTKLSYFNVVLVWHTPNNRFEFGVGTSLLNQITYYSQAQAVEQSSRVAGFRYSGRIRLEDSPRAVTDLTFADSPAMHGVRDSKIIQCLVPPTAPPCANPYRHVFDAEQASLVDITAQRTHLHGSFQFSYGLRYVNYVAHFSINGAPADHDLAIMPFIGFAFSPGR